MKIAVFGAGGVGGFFGGRLAQAGEEVTFIARGAHLDAIRANGLQVASIKGDFVIHPARATDRPEEIGVVDAVLVAVKAWQVSAAAAALKPVIGEHTTVIPLQNGVEAPGQLAAVLGAEHVLGGLCRISTMVGGPGQIRHVGLDPYIAFGELDGRPSERVEKLRQLFERAGLWVEVPADIRLALWEKFLFIAAISGVGAIARAPIGVIRSLPGTRAILQSALEEIVAVALTQGIGLTPAHVQNTLAYIDSVAPGVTSSMQRDIQEGRPSELDAQNGAVVRLGQAGGAPTPTHAFLYACLLPQEQKARGEIQ